MNERPTSPSGDDSEHRFSEKPPEEQGVERREGRKLDDFVIKTTTFPSQRKGVKEETILHYDTTTLEQAITNGSLPESELLMGRDSLEKKIAKMEDELQKALKEEAEFHEKGELPKYRVGSDDYRSYLNDLRAVYAENKDYIELADNTSLNISGGTREALLADVISWLRPHELEIVRFDDREQNPTLEELHEMLVNLEKGPTDHVPQPSTFIEITLDYPTLSHYMRLYNMKEKDDRKFSFKLVFLSSRRLLPDKTGRPIDLLSSLRIADHFKSKGYNVKLPFSDSAKSSSDELFLFHHVAV